MDVRLAPAARAQITRGASALPDRYDPRSPGVRDWYATVHNQGDLGTCWAFANIAALEASLLPGETWDLSEDNMITRSGFGPYPRPTDSWRDPKWYRYEYGGWDLQAVAYLTRWAGPVSEADDPYRTPKPPRRNPVRKHVQGVVMLPGRSSVTDNDVLKRLIVDYGAESVGMYWDPEAYNSYESDPTATQAAFYLPDERGENHGVAIVGWDDGFSAANFTGDFGPPEHDGAFLARNSWGPRFGEGGYFWISYDDASFAFDSCVAYSQVEDRGNYHRVYSYDKLGWTRSMGYGSELVWGANRFAGRSHGWLTAAGFYAPSSDTQYEVWVGPSLERLTRRAAGTVDLPGYATVKLDRRMRIRKRCSFVVAVRIVAPGVKTPMAVEKPVSAYRAFAKAERGQSYVRAGDRNAWKDLTRIRGYRNTNVCIKAYTTK